MKKRPTLLEVLADMFGTDKESVGAVALAGAALYKWFLDKHRRELLAVLRRRSEPLN